MSGRVTTYQWHLRQLMAAQGMFATTDLVAPLAERGVSLSREQVYRLVVGTPERLSLATLDGAVRHLVVHPERSDRGGRRAGPAAQGGRRQVGDDAPTGGRRPVRARIVEDPSD